MRPIMKRFATLLTIFGIWAMLVAPWGSIHAAEDLVAGAGFMRFMERRRAPDFSIEDLKGTRVRLEDLRGRIVLLNFWATW